MSEAAAGTDEAGAARRLAFAAAATATVVLASQLCGKAARDAIFLGQFEVTNLPMLLAISSALAIGSTLFFARKLTQGVPTRVVQIANFVSAVLLVAEWALLGQFPRAVATVVYIHQMLLGPILVSGFWSIVSECFDPRTARKVLGIVGGGATVGAVLGAAIAERVAALVGAEALLPTVALLQLVAMWRVGVLGQNSKQLTGGAVTDPPILDVVHKIAKVSLLRHLALIVVIVTVAAAMLDFVFKDVVSASADEDDLARVFAIFHGAVGISTAVVQWTVGRWALDKLGLAKTLASLPASVIGFGIAALAMPGLMTFVLLRGAENVLRNSLYREAYEVFYTPLLAHERRATKTVIDVGVERIGDVIGAVLVLAVIALVEPPTLVLLGIGMGLSAVGVFVALKAKQSYVEALERSLMAHQIELDDQDPADSTTRAAVANLRGTAGMSTQASLRASEIRGLAATGGYLASPSASGRWPFRKKRQPNVPERGAVDPTLARVSELVSDDPARIRSALLGELLSPAAVAYVVPLLGRKDVHAAAVKSLAKVAGPCLGQLVDASRDPLVPLAARIELPALIAAAVLEPGTGADITRLRSELARAGLTACLSDTEFEVRFRSAAALGELREKLPDLEVDVQAVFEGVRRELSVDPAVWKALEEATAVAADAAASHPGPRALSRASQHLATLLSLALPADPIRTAFQSLWSDDKTIRGVALEYLDNVLPDDIRQRMWLVLALEATAAEHVAAEEVATRDSGALGKTRRPVEDVLAELLKTRQPKHVHEVTGTQIDLPRIAVTRPKR